MDEEVGCWDVFETAAASFGEGGAKAAGYYYVVGGFSEYGFPAARDVDFGGGEVGLELGKALLGWPWALLVGMVGIRGVDAELTFRHLGSTSTG